MNNKTILIAILLTLITLYNVKYYFEVKKELKNTYIHSISIEKKAKEIIAIKKLQKLSIPRFCKKKENKIICDNLNKYQFYSFENMLKKAFIKSFSITKDKTINAYLEVDK